MLFEADTLDDLMRKVLTTLLNGSFDIEASRSRHLGKTSEVFGALLQLNNPRARLSKTETKGKAFSALGEFLWYLTKSNDLKFIKYYIKNYEKEVEKNGKIHGGYGPRLFKMHGKYNQVETITELLRKSPSTRRAVIQLFDASDTNDGKTKYKDIPCTCSLQFVIRNNKLSMLAYMRSNDAFLGLPHDIFCFTMLQEVIARELNIDVGIYHHAVGSMHLYKKHINQAKEYLNEGFQSTKDPMPAMPNGDPWPSLNRILKAEPSIRKSELTQIKKLKLEPYWEDIIRLLQIHTFYKNRNKKKLTEIGTQMNSRMYDTFITNKIQQLSNTKTKK